MNIKFGERIVTVQAHEQPEYRSRHTGILLRQLTIEFRVRGKPANDEFLELIEVAKREGLTSINEGGDIDKKWKVGNSSWSFTEGTPIYSHTLEIQEIEDLKIDLLLMSNLDLHPYFYHEEIDHDDRLFIRVKVTVSEAEHNQLKELWKTSDPQQITRKGISNEPILMVINMDGWSKHDVMYKHLLMLSEEPAKEDRITKRQFPALSWVSATANQAAANRELIGELLTTLEKKGILSSEETSHIRSHVEDRILDRKYELYRVEDIDEYE